MSGILSWNCLSLGCRLKCLAARKHARRNCRPTLQDPARVTTIKVIVSPVPAPVNSLNQSGIVSCWVLRVCRSQAVQNSPLSSHPLIIVREELASDRRVPHFHLEYWNRLTVVLATRAVIMQHLIFRATTARPTVPIQLRGWDIATPIRPVDDLKVIWLKYYNFLRHWKNNANYQSIYTFILYLFHFIIIYFLLLIFYLQFLFLFYKIITYNFF